MLADISCVNAIYIVCGYTDMGKSIDGLCAIIQNEFYMNVVLRKYNEGNRVLGEVRCLALDFFYVIIA